MKMAVPQFEDKACIRGALKSVLGDAFNNNSEAQAIINEIDMNTNTKGETMWNIDLLKAQLNGLFMNVEQIEIKPGDDFSKINANPVDNEESFGILFWHGTVGVNVHATRLLNAVNDTTVNLLDTTKPGGEIRDHSRGELFNASTEGFTFLRMIKAAQVGDASC